MREALVGIIGGSGLYAMDQLTDVKEDQPDTPYGSTSGPVVTGLLNGVPVAFIARHGKGHRLLPDGVPYRANIYALKELGARYVLSVSAVGSLAEQLHPLDIVLPLQYIDLTKNRQGSFFGEGAVAHVSMAQPVCPVVNEVLVGAAGAATENLPQQVHAGGTYVCIEGPQFSTYAESMWFRQMGAHVVGMTNMPEAKLAREAEIAYGAITMVTDYDCWHPTEEAVTADVAIGRLLHNADVAQKIVANAVTTLAQTLPASAAHTALDAGLVTELSAMSAHTKERLRVILGSRLES